MTRYFMTIPLACKSIKLTIALSFSALLSLLLMSFSSPADEQKVDGSNLSKHSFIQVGSAKFSVLFWDIYQSTLFTKSGQLTSTLSATTSANANNGSEQTILFEIKYLRDISRKDLIKRTVEQWQHLGMQQSDYFTYLPALEKIWPDIKKGDKLAVLLQQDSTIFYFNSQYLGDIKHPNFGQQFLAIWLDEKTSQPALRQQLIGASN